MNARRPPADIQANSCMRGLPYGPVDDLAAGACRQRSPAVSYPRHAAAPTVQFTCASPTESLLWS